MTINEKIEYIQENLNTEVAQKKLGKRSIQNLITLNEKLKGYYPGKLNKTERVYISKEDVEIYKEILRSEYDKLMSYSEEITKYFLDILSNLQNRAYRSVSLKFAYMIQQKRKERGISLQELSDKINVSVGYLNRLENGIQGTPTCQIAFSLAKILGIHPTELIEALNVEYDFYNQIPIEKLLDSDTQLFLDNEKLSETQVYELQELIKNYINQYVSKNTINVAT